MTGSRKFVISSAIVLFVVFTFSSAEAEKLQRTIMKVDRLYCGSCLAKINSNLSQLKGFIGIGADLRRSLVAVDHRKPLESKTVASKISSIGYPATIISESEIDEKNALSGNDRKRQYGCGNKGGACCGASSSAWKELYNRFSSKNSDKKLKNK